MKPTKMIKGKGVTSYRTRFSQVKDELVAVGVTISDGDMVKIALKGFIEEWKPSIRGVVARVKLVEWNRLWDDFIQEELRDEDLHPKNTFDDGVAVAA